MLLESCNCAFGGVNPVIVWDKVDVHMVASDMCFDCLGAFVVHHVEHWCIPMGIEVDKNVCEHCNHCTIVFGWHGADKDGI